MAVDDDGMEGRKEEPKADPFLSVRIDSASSATAGSLNATVLCEHRKSSGSNLSNACHKSNCHVIAKKILLIVKLLSMM